MKYRILKEISLLNIAQAGPVGCREFVDEWVNLSRRMRHHDSDLGTWVCISNHDHENKYPFKTLVIWAEEYPKRIQWLIDKGFIERVEPALAACPFHNSNDLLVIDEDDDGYFVRCKFCFARGPHTPCKKEAIKGWNWRA